MIYVSKQGFANCAKKKKRVMNDVAFVSVSEA